MMGCSLLKISCSLSQLLMLVQLSTVFIELSPHLYIHMSIHRPSVHPSVSRSLDLYIHLSIHRLSISTQGADPPPPSSTRSEAR
jgi:hypothetical protein